MKVACIVVATVEREAMANSAVINSEANIPFSNRSYRIVNGVFGDSFTVITKIRNKFLK